jgi:ribonuclease HII
MNLINDVVCGIDEVGRGALAGPLFAAAVLLNPIEVTYLLNSGLIIRDSKQLSHKQRELVYTYLIRSKIHYDLEQISVKQINSGGIQKANREIFLKLIKKIQANRYILDGKVLPSSVNNKNQTIQSLPHADEIVPAVMLAGIVAKVKRDRYMEKLDLKYPQYKWFSNSGYGTKFHIEQIINYGITIHHRNLFVTTAIKNYQEKFLNKS